MSIQPLMIGLWIAWAVVLFGGYVLGKPQADGRRIPLLNRMGASLLLTIAAWAFHFSSEQTLVTQFIAQGMTLGFIGDLFMARLFIKGPHYVLAGMLSFGVGHIFYILGIAWALHLRLFEGLGAMSAGVSVWLIAALILWDRIVYQSVAPGEKPTPIHYGALPYSLLLATTAGAATGAFLDNAIWGWMALGAALFLISDMILAIELFRKPGWRWLGDAVWLTYSPGQMFIVYAFFISGMQIGV